MFLRMYERPNLGCAHIADGTVVGCRKVHFAIGAHTRRRMEKRRRMRFAHR